MNGKTVVAFAFALAACSDGSSTSPPVVTATVSCAAPVVAQTSQQPNFATCTIGAGACSDGSTYILSCTSTTADTTTSCQCAVDGVISDGVTFVATSCATASAVTAKQIERAWLDCGVDLTFGH